MSKKAPKTEHIARMIGKTTFHDLKEGFAPGTFIGDSDADIKHALGLAQDNMGEAAVQALMTRFASTLAYERPLRRAWAKERREGAFASGANRGRDGRQAAIIDRVASALAIRELAGAALSKTEIEEWAWLLFTSQPTMTQAVRDCREWLDDMVRDAKDAFLGALGEEAA